MGDIYIYIKLPWWLYISDSLFSKVETQHCKAAMLQLKLI